MISVGQAIIFFQIASYGARLTCEREFRSSSYMGDNFDVILVGNNGMSLYWSGFSSKKNKKVFS